MLPGEVGQSQTALGWTNSRRTVTLHGICREADRVGSGVAADAFSYDGRPSGFSERSTATDRRGGLMPPPRSGPKAWPPGTFLGSLGAATQTVALSLGTLRQFPAHHVLIREGEKARDVILLRQAYVKVTAGVGGSREALIDIRASGDVVGEVAALDGSPRSATVTTCGNALVSTITADEFATFLSRHPDAGLALSRRLASRAEVRDPQENRLQQLPGERPTGPGAGGARGRLRV